MVNLGSLGVAPTAHGLHPLQQTSGSVPSSAPCTVCLEKWGVIVSTMVCVCISPTAQEHRAACGGDGAVEGEWMETAGRGCGGVAGLGDGELEQSWGLGPPKLLDEAVVIPSGQHRLPEAEALM